MKTQHALVFAVLLSLSVSACGTDEETTEPAVTAEAAPPNLEATPAEVPAAPAAPEVSLTPPGEGETTTLLSLREGFAADAAAWTGQRVTLRAQFMSATSVGGHLNNISLVVSRDDYAEDRMRHSIMCAFGDDAPESVSLMQYDEVTVRATVVERFGRAGLDDCQIVAD